MDCHLKNRIALAFPLWYDISEENEAKEAIERQRVDPAFHAPSWYLLVTQICRDFGSLSFIHPSWGNGCVWGAMLENVLQSPENAWEMRLASLERTVVVWLYAVK